MLPLHTAWCLLILVARLIQAGDPCLPQNHRELNDLSSSRSNHTRTGDVATCDRNSQAGWYRVISPAGGDMINTCPAKNTCSTRNPIWMEGDPPSNDQMIHPRSAFVNVDGNCKAEPLCIQVKNCTHFNVYYLNRPGSCPTAYCFGDKAPCSEGESSPTGRQPGCSRNFPALNQDPVVDWTVKHRPNNENRLMLVLRCNLTRPQDLPKNTVLHVIWFKSRNGELSQTEQFEILPSELPHELPEGDWGKPNPDIYVLNTATQFNCSMRVAGKDYSSPSPWRHSAHITAEIKVSRFIDVVVGPVVPLTLEPSLPILNDDLRAEINVPLTTLRTCRPNPRVTGIVAQNMGPQCQIKLKAVMKLETWRTEWENIRKNPSSFMITATSMGQNINPFKQYINITTTLHHYRHPLWQNFHLPIVTAIVNNGTDNTDQSQSVCHSQNDPHLRTFDGCFYDMHLRGEFVFYRNTRFDTQVNIVTKACTNNPSVSCNCGVTVRSGETTYTINYCDDHRTRIGFINCIGRELSVERKTSGYVITLATGAAVSISGIQGRWISRIAITPTPHDFHKTSGLCGRYNGNPNDDFYPRGSNSPNPNTCQRSANMFADSWKVKPGDNLSLWNGYQMGPLQDRPMYCRCVKEQGYRADVSCNPGNLRERCTVWGQDVTEQQLRRCLPPQGRSSDSGSDFSDMTAPPLNFTDDPPLEPPEWTNGWNEASARAYCEQSILNTPAGRQCCNLILRNRSSHVEDCVKDIHVTGETVWVRVGLEGLVDQCNNEVQRNTTTWEDDGETARPPPAITRTLCPSNCNNRGQCVDSVCQCSPGYGTPDCSLDFNQSPDITGVTNNGKCDSRQRPCRATPVFGTNFVDSGNLTCRIAYSNIYRTGASAVSGIADTQAMYMHDAEIMCPFYPSAMQGRMTAATDHPMAQVYAIAVSNDAVNYSREVIVVKYDGKCVDCDTRALTCHIKSGTCRIAGGCYYPKEANPKDPCSTCNPDENGTQWTVPTVPSCRIEGNCYQGGHQKVVTRCLYCDPPANIQEWTLQHGFCFIDSKCVTAGTINPQNQTQICDPQRSKNAWTPAGSAPGNSQSAVIVVVAVLGSVAAVGVITTGAAMTVKKIKRKSKVEPAPVDSVEMSPAREGQ